jgi:hypothetical protein
MDLLHAGLLNQDSRSRRSQQQNQPKHLAEIPPPSDELRCADSIARRQDDSPETIERLMRFSSV